MYQRSAAEKPRKDSAGFYTLRGRKFLYRNFRTTLERPTVRSCLSAKPWFRDSLKRKSYRLAFFICLDLFADMLQSALFQSGYLRL